VHRERPRPSEPPFVAGALEERQECVAVPRRAVTEVRTFSQRPGAPRQLAAGDRKLLVEEMPERADDPRRAVAPLRSDLAVAVRVECHPRKSRPVDEPVLFDGETTERLRDVGDVAERKRASCEPVRRAEKSPYLPVQVLRPEAVRLTSAVQPLDARRHVEPELATRENRAGAPPHQLATFVLPVRRDQLRQALEIRLRRRMAL
jgi:hypothetical protein